MTTYAIVSLDVWGNETDGYEVNASYNTGRTIDIPPEASDAEILAMLAHSGELTENASELGAVEPWGEADLTITEKSTGRPVLDLRAIED